MYLAYELNHQQPKQINNKVLMKDLAIEPNVFHPLTYEKSNQHSLDDPIMRQAREIQIAEFGQTPK